MTAPRSFLRENPWPVVLTLAGISLVILVVMNPWWIVSSTTPTGGDMGAHVLGPAFLRDSLLPEGRIQGWSNDWFAGFPAFYFYFPLPSLTIVFLDLFIPYGVAFKLVTVSGIVAALIIRNRSTMRAASLMMSPPRLAQPLPFKFVVSTTSVSPSHRPRGSPIHRRMFEGRC